MASLTDRDLANVSPEDKTYVIYKNKVYDITKFVNVHPGGKNVLRLRHRKDVTKIMEKGPHKHSKNAYRWLEQYCIGEYCKDALFPPDSSISSNGVHKEENNKNAPFTNKQYEPTSNGKTDLINWDEPVLWQVGYMGEKYHDWIDDPVDRPLRLFKSDFVEFFSNTPWYVIPMFWLPVVCTLIYRSYSCFAASDVFLFSTLQAVQLSLYVMPFLFVFGALSWTFVEYALHRWLFHRDPPTTSYFLITLHFLLHGQHHKVPFDSGRLVFPPVAASCFVVILYPLFRLLLVGAIVDIVTGGLIFGYVCYDLTHYYLHHGSPRKGGYFDILRAYHVRHHFESPHLGFGISSKLWDYPFDTLIKSSKKQNGIKSNTS